MCRETMATTKRRRTSPEKRVQRRVIRALQDLGFWAMDMSQPRRSMMPVGLPDIYALHGRYGSIWIEVKAPKRGKKPEQMLSVGQEGWHAAAREYGQRVVTVDSVECLLVKMREVGVLEEVAAQVLD